MEKDCIAVIAAEEQELAGLAEFLSGAVRIEGAAGCSYLIGEAGRCCVVAMRCGIGKVNAAIGTQAMIDAYHPRALINIGAAGALAPGLEVYDVVISTDAVQHDMDVTALGYAPGVVPDQKESYFQADPGLIREAREAGEAEGLRIFEGRVASGDLFVADEAARRRIAGLFGALCAEMEGAAVAQTCLRNQIPFVIIRSISDTAGQDAGVSYGEFSAKAAAHAVHILKRMISARQ